MPRNTQRNARRKAKQNGGFRPRNHLPFPEQNLPQNHLKHGFAIANSPPTIRRINYKKPKTNSLLSIKRSIRRR